MPGYNMWKIAPILITVVLCSVMPGLAHHGGLGIEFGLAEWAQKVDQWQAEVQDRGYRIKFLSLPRRPILNQRTRLVFEIQSVASGQYVGGLTAELSVRAPDGTTRTVPLPETTGVTAYYEAVVVFDQIGEHYITFRSTAAGTDLIGGFNKVVRRSVLGGEWHILVGNLVVVGAFLVTWLGLLASLQRRFMHP